MHSACTQYINNGYYDKISPFFSIFVGKKVAKQEDLKEMGDISSGMSSSIMQLYLKQVLEAFFHTQSSVRHFALNVIALTLNQGLIHPVQVYNCIFKFTILQNIDWEQYTYSSLELTNE